MVDTAHAMKTRLRADLRVAMKEGRSSEAKLIRALVAAIDNAEAPPLRAGERATDQHRFHDGSAEVERLSLTSAQVRAVLVAEMQEHERAAAEMSRVGRPDRADALHAETLLVRRYIE
nr:GatB/YqeY domain-containing protein [Rhizobium sp. ACO-34A]